MANNSLPSVFVTPPHPAYRTYFHAKFDVDAFVLSVKVVGPNDLSFVFEVPRYGTAINNELPATRFLAALRDAYEVGKAEARTKNTVDEKLLTALRTWVQMQSLQNTNNLYNIAVDVLGLPREIPE
jgi:hypothetical protein